MSSKECIMEVAFVQRSSKQNGLFHKSYIPKLSDFQTVVAFTMLYVPRGLFPYKMTFMVLFNECVRSEACDRNDSLLVPKAQHLLWFSCPSILRGCPMAHSYTSLEFLYSMACIIQKAWCQYQICMNLYTQMRKKIIYYQPRKAPTHSRPAMDRKIVNTLS